MHDETTTESVDPVAYAGGVIVSGTSVQLAGQVHPALTFTFLAPQGGSYAPTTLVVADPYVDELPDILRKAIASAREAARGSDS